MSVCPHSALPLTVNLRSRPTGGSQGKDSDPWEASILREEYRNYLRRYDDAINRNDLCEEDVLVDYEFRNLWTANFRWTTEEPQETKGSRFSPLGVKTKTRKATFFQMSPLGRVHVLRNQTHWYKRLSPPFKTKVNNLCVNKGGLLQLKEILHCADAVVMGLLLGFPEMIHSTRNPYEVTDRVAHSVIQNLLQNYANFSKKVKSYRKLLRNSVFKGERIPIPPRELSSCFSQPRAILNKVKDNSRVKIYKTMAISQTRAWGLADRTMSKQTIQSFLETVANPQPFEPSPSLLEAIDKVTTRIADFASLPENPNTKVSISTSACLESSRGDEGKFGYLKQFVRDVGIEPESYTLRYGAESGKLANIIWPMSLLKAQQKDRKIMEVNVCAVRENGKARVVTSGSFWKDTLLQPLSHLTIELIKSEPTIREAVQAARHGYRFMERLQKDPTFWHYAQRARFYCTDWEKATDNPSHESGRATMGPLLRKLQIPDSVVEDILGVWVGEKKLKVGGKIIGTMKNGIPMGDPLTKTNLCLAHPICMEYANIELKKRGIEAAYSIAAGNGDDVVALYTHPLFPEFYSGAAKMLGYKESPEDTFTSDLWGFYCEEVLTKPLHGLMTEKWSRRFSRLDLMPYLDYPRIRLLVDTQKDRDDFSSRPNGKITLLGKEVSYLPRNTCQYESYQLASILQDVGLSVFHGGDKAPWAVPRHFWGVGKPPAYHNALNYGKLLKKFPLWQELLMRVVIKEFLSGNRRLLLRRGLVRSTEKHFQGEADLEFYRIPEDDPLNGEVFLNEAEQELVPKGVLTSLIDGGYLKTEPQVNALYLYNKRLISLAQDVEEADLMNSYKDEIGENSNLVAATNEEVSEFIANWRSVRTEYQFRIDHKHRIWDARTIAALRESDPLHADFVKLLPTLGDKITEMRGRKRRLFTDHDQKLQDSWEWLLENIPTIREGKRPEAPFLPDMYDEDDVIADTVRYSDAKAFLIITGDFRLFRRIVDENPDKLIMNSTPFQLHVGREILNREIRNPRRTSYRGIPLPGTPYRELVELEFILRELWQPEVKVLFDEANIETFGPSISLGAIPEISWTDTIAATIPPTPPGLDLEGHKGSPFNPEAFLKYAVGDSRTRAVLKEKLQGEELVSDIFKSVRDLLLAKTTVENLRSRLVIRDVSEDGYRIIEIHPDGLETEADRVYSEGRSDAKRLRKLAKQVEEAHSKGEEVTASLLDSHRKERLEQTAGPSRATPWEQPVRIPPPPPNSGTAWKRGMRLLPRGSGSQRGRPRGKE